MNIHQSIYYFFFWILIFNNIVFVYFSHLLWFLFLSTTHHGKIHWTNLQTWSIPNLNSVNQGIYYVIFRFSKIIFYWINNNFCPLYQRQKCNQFRFVIQKFHPEWFKHHKKWQHTFLWGTKKFSIPTTSTPNHHAQHIAATSVSLLNLHKTRIWTEVGKSYMYFQNDGKTVQKARCIKSNIMTRVIDYVLLIDTF